VSCHLNLDLLKTLPMNQQKREQIGSLGILKNSIGSKLGLIIDMFSLKKKVSSTTILILMVSSQVLPVQTFDITAQETTTLVENGQILLSTEKVQKSFDPRFIDFYKEQNEIELAKFEEIILDTVPFTIREMASKFVKDIITISLHYELDPIWVFSVIWTESHFRQFAISPKDARGLMQILPSTGSFILGREVTQLSRYDQKRELADELLNNHRLNLELGVIYLRYLLNDVFDGDFKLATVAYNMGPNGVKRRLRDGLPVGVRNSYLNKVSDRYEILKGPFVKEYLAQKQNSSDLYASLGNN
jgi:hypothetical protein